MAEPSSLPLKQILKSRPWIYQLAKRADQTLRSLPYWVPTQISCERLILGSAQKVEGWTTFDARPGADLLGDIRDLRRFQPNSLSQVYASHVLEHVTCADARQTLEEIYRILKPGGEVFVGVPCLETLASFLSSDQAELAIDILYGVNRPTQEWQPQHLFGYTRQTLSQLLSEVGFQSVQEFVPFLADTTQMTVQGKAISICLKGQK